jgi:RNA polymerase sigma factor (sigma-70 family)
MTAPTFDERFDCLAAIAYRVAFRILDDRGEAEEVAQEALARAYVRWRRVAGYDEAWVTRVAINESLGRRRKHRPTVPLAAGHQGLHAGQERSAEQRMILVDAVRRLSRRQREVVALRYLVDLPEAEVAALLDTSVGSVKQHAHRAVGRLRADLGLATLNWETE